MTRSPFVPDVPTFAEQGFPELTVEEWFGFYAPARTPAPILERLHRELNTILAQPDVRKTFEDQAATVGKGSAAEFGDFLRREMTRNAAVVKAANIKAE